MKNALLIGFFSDDVLLRETYNAMRAELSVLGYSMEGIQPEGVIASGYEFPAYSFKDFLSGIRISKARKACCLLTYSLPFRVEKSYAEMQTQGANLRGVLKCLHLLIEFRNHLSEFLAFRKIDFMILNHQFSGYHLMAGDVCRRAGIPFVYWHPGFLPGTMSFDREGQMAESEINAIIERELPTCGVAEEELGKNYRKWCRDQAYVRPGKSVTSNTTSLKELNGIKYKFRNVLLVIGSNDYRTGMLPRSYRSSHVHSKLLRSSAELYHMSVEHTEDDTLVIYKPHPNLSPPKAGIQWDSGRSFRLFDVTIRDLLPHVTAVATLCSSGAYEAMLFGISTAIIGEIPGSRAGACYTLDPNTPVFSDTLRAAISQGMTPEMETRLNLLIGFLLKKYFFASGASACPLVQRTLREALANALSSHPMAK